MSPQNILTRVYTSRINPDSTSIEAYGYWLIVTGILIGVVGIASFLWGSTFPRGDPTYWSYRQVGIALSAFALPVALLGVTFRLPLQPSASAVGALGLLVCASAVVWFVTLYPSGWTFAGPLPVILTYTGGLLLLGAGMVVVPLTATPVPVDRSPDAVRHPYYSIVRRSEGWGWTLYGSDGEALAESTTAYPDRRSTQNALDAMSTKAPTAGIRLTDEEVQVDGGAD